MATFTVLDSISKSDTFPITYDYSAEYNCGILSLEISSAWSNQMLLELPCINFKILKGDGTLFRTFSINMSTVNTDLNTGISAAKPYIIPFYDIPKSGSFHITPMFDKNAIAAHNEMERNGIVNSINTTNKGVVTSDDIDIWTNTDVFDITIEFSNDNISSGGAGGGGGDTPTLIDKNITANGTYLASDDDADGYSSVTVDVPSGGESTTKKDVNFYDYDGTVVHSYTAEEFANLTDWPSNPEHDGLTAQGWMWSTFAKAKAYVSKYGKLDIGQKYRVTDGKTRIFIELDEYRREPILGLGVDGSVDIDWGDGSAHTTLTGTSVSTYVSTQPHTYPSGGEYVITLTVTGTANFVAVNALCGLLMKNTSSSGMESQSYRNAIKKLFIGNNITSIFSYAFHNCSSLSSIIIPDSVTAISSQVFYYCYSLNSVTIPDSATSIGQGFAYYCSSLRSITIPDNVTTIGYAAFQYCSSLDSITIPNSVTSISSDTFQHCYSLNSVTIPDNVTTIGSTAFESCYSLNSVTIPDSVTSISAKVFQYCYSLNSVTIPDNVTTIQYSAFNNCSSLDCVKFEKTTPPTVHNSNTFAGLPTDCIILVKSYAYLSASNYPSPSTYTYAYYDTIADGTTLPATIPDESTTSLTWYATIADLRAETNPITVGNGKEIYAKMTAV